MWQAQEMDQEPIGFETFGELQAEVAYREQHPVDGSVAEALLSGAGVHMRAAEQLLAQKLWLSEALFDASIALDAYEQVGDVEGVERAAALMDRIRTAQNREAVYE